MMDKEKLEGVFILGVVTLVSLFVFVYYKVLIDWLMTTPLILKNLVFMTLGFLGTVSVVIPVPYTAIIFTLSSVYPEINPIETAVFVGLGSGVGEFLGWVLGRGVGKTLRAVRGSRYSAALAILEDRIRRSRLMPLVLIYLFALTPLPDKILFIALGTLGYPLKKALLPAIAGKITMVYILVISGRLIGGLVEEYGGTYEISLLLALASIAFFYLVLEVYARRVSRALGDKPS